MEGESWLTIFRSAETSAEEEARELVAILQEAGLCPLLLNDRTPGVPPGAWEVRVRASEVERAEAVLRSALEAEPSDSTTDPSPELDMEPLFRAVGTSAEVEALNVRAALEAHGIPALLVQVTPYPNLEWIVSVPRKMLAQARQLLADLQSVEVDWEAGSEQDSKD